MYSDFVISLLSAYLADRHEQRNKQKHPAFL